MGSVLASNAVDRGFESPSGKTKDYEIGICCFSPKHVALMSKCKDWLARKLIMCPSGETRVPVDCCFSEVTL
jgi:hypothetical protein